jgi:2-aminomuconate deaminase
MIGGDDADMNENTQHSLAKPLGRYPFLRRAGDFIYLSGVSARLPNGTIAGVEPNDNGFATDIRVQTRTVLDKIRTVLASVDAQLSDCVEIIAFLTNMDDFAAYNEVYAEYFDATGPVRTTIGVCALPHPNMVVEMRAVAFMKSGPETDRIPRDIGR